MLVSFASQTEDSALEKYELAKDDDDEEHMDESR
jgi:hypothetical protein